MSDAEEKEGFEEDEVREREVLPPDPNQLVLFDPEAPNVPTSVLLTETDNAVGIGGEEQSIIVATPGSGEETGNIVSASTKAIPAEEPAASPMVGFQDTGYADFEQRRVTAEARRKACAEHADLEFRGVRAGKKVWWCQKCKHEILTYETS